METFEPSIEKEEEEEVEVEDEDEDYEEEEEEEEEEESRAYETPIVPSVPAAVPPVLTLQICQARLMTKVDIFKSELPKAQHAMRRLDEIFSARARLLMTTDRLQAANLCTLVGSVHFKIPVYKYEQMQFENKSGIYDIIPTSSGSKSQIDQALQILVDAFENKPFMKSISWNLNFIYRSDFNMIDLTYFH